MSRDDSHYDDLVIGSGMGGLTVASLLSRAGRRVLVLEAHDVPGGYAHTFRMRDFRFCAQVHYIFNCGEGESIHNFLTKLGADEEVPFVRLDPEGFDHVVVAGERVRIPTGLGKFRDRLIRRQDRWERLSRFLDWAAPGVVRFRYDTYWRVTYGGLSFRARRQAP